jgi:D-3-phosphoglycerate dehydrogenase
MPLRSKPGKTAVVSRQTAGSCARGSGSSNREAATIVATGINTETSNREQEMPKFKVVTPKGASFTTAGGGYALEREALDPIGAEITEAPANEADFIAAAKGADAIYAKGMRISKEIIDALENCKVITLGSVGVDSVDVKAATARGIPVTNIPDTFIEEVADHAMMLLLAGFRRLIAQDRMVREGRWSEGRPALLKIPRLIGQTLGFISFGRVARAVAKRAAPFGLRMMAYDPFISETLISDHGVLPATLSEVLAQSDFVSMHAPARPEVHHMLGEAHFRQMKPSAIFINTGRGATVNEETLIKALQEGWIAHAALDVLETEPPSHNNPMLSMDNVTMTAHVASASARFDEARKRRVGFELSLVLSGLWPASCVNPSVLQNTSLRRWQPVSMERGPNS